MSFVDPSGEIAWFIPMIIGAAINVATNGISNLQNGEKFFKGAGRSAAMGAISGLISFGIGEITSGMVGIEKIISQTLLHSYAGAASAIANGSDVGAGALAGALGSLASAGTGALLQKANNGVKALGMIGTGAVMGGVSSKIAGGSFKDGLTYGAISSTLNHVFHHFAQELQDEIQKNQEKNTINKVEQALTALGLSTEVKNAIIQGLTKGELPPAFEKYLKGSRIAGRALGGLGAGLKIDNYMQNPTTANLLDAFAAIGLIRVPYANIAVGALDISGYSTNVYNFLGNYIDSRVGYSVGNAVYNWSERNIQQYLKP